MKRFILITFGFMAWGFYELSGGDEFEPMRASVQASTPVEQAELPAAPVAQDDAVQPQTVAFVDTDPPEVTTPVAQVAAAPIETTQEDAAAVETVASNEVPENVDVARSDAVVLSSSDTPAIIPSLIVRDTTQETQVAALEPANDVRRVSGSRVNVRGGPGTDYGVVTRLLRGDEVEVIQDNGDGWVKMRPIEGGPVGWMADFLLTSG